jgi:hypothetical protein
VPTVKIIMLAGRRVRNTCLKFHEKSTHSVFGHTRSPTERKTDWQIDGRSDGPPIPNVAFIFLMHKVAEAFYFISLILSENV